MQQIILASASPRRKDLLEQLIGKKFKTVVSSYEEDHSLRLSPVQLVKFHARGKGRDVAKKLKSGIIISADTMVVCNNQILGKPKDRNDARRMLNLQSGKFVKVITGLTVIDIQNKKEITEHEMTKVKMAKMTYREIENYIGSKEGEDKAGAFAMQGKGTLFVERIDGDYFNVIGLPLYRLGSILKKIGVNLLTT